MSPPSVCTASPPHLVHPSLHTPTRACPRCGQRCLVPTRLCPCPHPVSCRCAGAAGGTARLGRGQSTGSRGCRACHAAPTPCCPCVLVSAWGGPVQRAVATSCWGLGGLWVALQSLHVGKGLLPSPGGGALPLSPAGGLPALRRVLLLWPPNLPFFSSKSSGSGGRGVVAGSCSPLCSPLASTGPELGSCPCPHLHPGSTEQGN